MFIRHDLIHDSLRTTDGDRSRQAAERFQLAEAVRQQRSGVPRRPARRSRWYAVRRTG